MSLAAVLGGSLVCLCIVGESRKEEKRDKEGFCEVLERWAGKEMRDSYFV